MRVAVLVVLCIFPSTTARAQQFTDALFCQAMQEAAAKSNKDAGSKVDSVTTHLGMAVLCNMKVVDFKKRLDVAFSVLGGGWEDRKQVQWSQIYCSNPGFSQAIAGGWTISSTITDADGKRHYMEARCR